MPALTPPYWYVRIWVAAKLAHYIAYQRRHTRLPGLLDICEVR